MPVLKSLPRGGVVFGPRPLWRDVLTADNRTLRARVTWRVHRRRKAKVHSGVQTDVYVTRVWQRSDGGRRITARVPGCTHKRKSGKIVRSYFPPRSPDLNPIENMFGMAEQELLERAVKDKITKPDAEEKCVKRFEEILAGLATSGKIKKLARSMPDRIKACIAAEGGATDY